MEAHHLISDSDFEAQFQNCSLNPQLFTHEAHLRLAWIHVSRYGVDVAIGNITAQLQAFVNFLGATGKYNHTVTIAAIRAVNHYYLRSKSKTYIAFIGEFPQLKNQFKELMQFHYEINIFTSEKAKKVFIEPDRHPFD